MNPISYLRDKGLRRALQVAWRYKLPKLQVSVVAALTRRRPLQDKIVIESHDDFDCNGGAFYDYLVENGYNERVKIVWRLNRPCDRELPANVTWVPLYGPSWRKAWHICTAKWLTADCVVADRVRDDQVSVYMTHGVFALKNFKGLSNMPDSIDLVLSPSAEMDGVFREMRGITNPKTELVHLGYPSLDRLYERRHSPEYRQHRDNGALRILWMPTFRKGVAWGRDDSSDSFPYGVPLVKTGDDLEDLATFLGQRSVKLVIKLHPKQDLSGIADDDFRGVAPHIEFLTGETIKAYPGDNYDLMLDADALITDYSGAVFEYLALNRPVAFITEDASRYKIGLVPNAERYMPGPKINSIDELKKFIGDVCGGRDGFARSREQFRCWFYTHNEGGASERIAERIGITGELRLRRPC